MVGVSAFRRSGTEPIAHADRAAGKAAPPDRKPRSGPSTVAGLIQLQRTVGNAAVVRMLAPGRAVGANPVVQRRGENPYAQTGAHQGWDLTAHHIVAHSTLVGSLDKLDPDQKAEILRNAIPRVITDEMLDNLKVKIPTGQNKEKFRFDLRAKLVSTAPDDETVSEIRLGDMRHSFFEWQGGNQFLGPNTSIRPEPSASKDDIDYDGRFFTTLSEEQFGRLVGYGTQLKTATEKGTIAEILNQILAITRDMPPRPFDSAGWVEVGSLDELERLASSDQLRRLHLRGYAFFKLSLSDIGVGKKYDKLASAYGEFKYESLGAPVQVKGTFGYIPLDTAKEIVPQTKVAQPLKTVLAGIEGLTMTPGTGTTRVKWTGGVELVPDKKNFKLRVVGYEELIPCSKKGEMEAEIPNGILDNKQLFVTTDGKSLYKYCQELDTPTATYLPQQLYDELKAEEASSPKPKPKPKGLNPNALPFYPGDYVPGSDKAVAQ